MFGVDKEYYEVINKLAQVVEHDGHILYLLTNPIITIYYYFDDDGVIKLFKPETYKEVKQNNNNTTGYLRIKIPSKYQFTDKSSLYIHQIIAMIKYNEYLFILNHTREVDHIDGDIRNNTLNNIQLLSKAENLQKRRKIKQSSFIVSHEAVEVMPELFNNLYIDKSRRLLLHPTNLPCSTFKILNPTNKELGNYVITDKNKSKRNININKLLDII